MRVGGGGGGASVGDGGFGGGWNTINPTSCGAGHDGVVQTALADPTSLF